MKKSVLNQAATRRVRSQQTKAHRANPTRKAVAPQGTYIVLLRSYSMPDASAQESCPAAIINTKRSTCAAVGSIAREYLQGLDWTRWTSVKKGARRSVMLLSPWVPEAKFIRAFFEVELDWREWHGTALPSSDADAILVWLPRRALPGITERQIAERLLAEAFGGGAIYTVYGFDSERLKAEGVADV